MCTHLMLQSLICSRAVAFLNLNLNFYFDWGKPLAQMATIKVPSQHMTYTKYNNIKQMNNYH